MPDYGAKLRNPVHTCVFRNMTAHLPAVLFLQLSAWLGVQDAQRKLAAENPDKVVTVGGNCMVSLAPFDYLHGKYENVGIVWIDAHPDVSTLNDGHPSAHAMVLGSLLGQGAPQLVSRMRHPVFKPSDVLHVGLQQLHDYQEACLNKRGVENEIQTDAFVTGEEIKAIISKFDHVLVHFDIGGSAFLRTDRCCGFSRCPHGGKRHAGSA